MPIEQKELEGLLKEHFPNASIKVDDLAGDNDHYSVEISCDSFYEKSRIEQHRMVQEAVKAKDIHALSIKTRSLKD